jgi:uncharacterized protein YdiU (UPF0061 family)
MPLSFDNSYARLPSRFTARVMPSASVAPRLIVFNAVLAAALGLEGLNTEAASLARTFSGLEMPDGADPLAMAYAGHQFGHFVPQLGDGRAILLGEIIGKNGQRYDIQLKGAGQTPFSRRGDGRAALGPVLREYLVSEAMAALRVPTTRSLAAVLTGAVVYREAALPGAILTRVARSHIRVGTFQYFAARDDLDALRLLTDYALDRHYPQVRHSAVPALALLEAVSTAQAELVALWMLAGFVHGVMNTDNMAVSGDTIDYGPCAFLDVYDPNTVFSSIDEHGRYAFANQPRVAQWNLARFAETLLPLIDTDSERAVAAATEILNRFGGVFEAAFLRGMRAKIGLTIERPGDRHLVQGLLSAMAQGQADFTLTFRSLADALTEDHAAAAHFTNPGPFAAWASLWRDRMAEEAVRPDDRRAAMRLVNPARIPRNHHIEQVIQAAAGAGDFGPFHAMAAALAQPFDDDPAFTSFDQPPEAHERVERTFCGT